MNTANDILVKKYEADLVRARRRQEEAEMTVAQLEHILSSIKSMPMPVKGVK